MNLPKVQVRLYTKPGCHLCEVAKEQMLAANCVDLYVFEEINIETDPELNAKYCQMIPVVTVNGIEAFNYRVDALAFRELVLNARKSQTI